MIARRYGLQDNDPPAIGRGDADTAPPSGAPFGPPREGGPTPTANPDDVADAGADGNPDEDQPIFFSLP